MYRLSALAILVLALPAAADSSDARTVAPYLDDQTLAVVRVDATKWDADALATVLGAGPDEPQHVKASAGRWLTAFTKAGGKQLYIVFSLADLPAVPFVIAPMGPGADATALARLLDLPGVPAGPREKLGDAVFAGSAAARDRVRALKPVERPELASAFAAAGDGAVQLALIPPAPLVRVVDELMPVLPREVGGGPMRVLTRGLKWAALGLDAPPRMALRLHIQAADVSSAGALRELIGKTLKGLSELPGVREALPEVEKTAALIEPRVAGDHVVMALEGDKGAAVIGPLLRRAAELAGRRESIDHLQRLALALHHYADAHHSTMPAVANFDAQGKPLLSWRVHLLPYVGEESLYKEFHLDEPWDSEHNKKLLARMPAIYRGPSPRLNEQGKTVFLAPVGKDVAFTGDASGRRMPHDFPDGTSNTILLVQADAAHAVEWTRPEDLRIDPANPHAGLVRPMGHFLLAMADAAVVLSVKATVSKETLWAAFTANGGEVLGADWP
jgi:hypothetical protein